MKYPDGYLWDFPGIPSIAVSYLKSNDFFFSGHVGLPIIIGLEFLKIENKTMFWFCMFTFVFEGINMIVMRGHYIIDILTGIVVSHYVFILCDKYIYLVDNSCLAMDHNKPIIADSTESKPIISSNKNNEN